MATFSKANMNLESDQQVEPLGKSPNSIDAVDALHSVVCDVEAFMTDWLERAQCELAGVDTSAGNATLRRGFQGLQAEKRQWEAKRRCELEAIEEKANQLTDAWLKLESEQRQLLKNQDRQRGPRRQATAEPVRMTVQEPVRMTVQEQSSPPAEPARQPIRRTTNSIDAEKRNCNRSIRSVNDSVRQFQQLRREIEMTRAAT
ncbi:MAG: hypothetical protein P8L85_19315 [Rubripirellula sp.]|nr:hypothetical protein [Rubripirellula sp.]